MKKGLKITLIIVGSVLAFVAVDLVVSAIYRKATSRIEKYEITESFKNIDINTSVSDIEFIKSSTTEVVVKETKYERHIVKVENDTLKIDFDHKYKFNFLMLPLDFKVQVYAPFTDAYKLNLVNSTGDVYARSECSFADTNIQVSTGDVDFRCNINGDLKVNVTTGDVCLSNMSVLGKTDIRTSTGKQSFDHVKFTEGLTLKSTTGSSTLSDIETSDLNVDTTTGKVKLNNVKVSKKMNISTSTGDVEIKRSDAEEVNIKTTTGDVTADFLTSKIVSTRSSTGEVDVPKSTTGGICSIETTTGDIKVTF